MSEMEKLKQKAVDNDKLQSALVADKLAALRLADGAGHDEIRGVVAIGNARRDANIGDICHDMSKQICEGLKGKPLNDKEVQRVGDYLYRCSTLGQLGFAVVEWARLKDQPPDYHATEDDDPF